MDDPLRVYIKAGIVGFLIIFLGIIFGAFFISFFANMDELANTTAVNPSHSTNYHDFIAGPVMPRIFGTVVLCAIIGVVLWAALKSMSKEYED